MPDSDKQLKVAINLETTGQAQAAAANDALKVIKQTTGEASDATKKAASATEEAAADDKKAGEEVRDLTLKKRETLEALHELIRQYPLLGEAVRAAFNPLTIATAALAESITIAVDKYKTAVEVLGGFELPDLTIHASGVSAAAEAYDKLKTAAEGADTEFASAAGIFERQKTAIQDQLTATKALIAAQKEKAIADLDLERASGKLTPATYEARKSIIEQGYSDATTQAEINARNQDLAARKAEAGGLAWQSARDEAKARAIQPGLNDEGLDELINKAKSTAEEAKKDAEKFRAEEAEAKRLQEIKEEPSGFQRAKDIAVNAVPTLEMEKKYGVVGFDKIAQMNAEAAAKAESTAAVAEQQQRELEAQKKKRDDLREKAAKEAADAETKRLELQGEDDPKKIGSVAWQNAQAVATQKTRDSAGLENRLTKDVDQFNKDVVTYNKDAAGHDPEALAKAKKAHADMFAALQDAAAVINSMAQQGDNVTALRMELAELSRKYNELSGQNQHASNIYGSG